MKKVNVKVCVVCEVSEPDQACGVCMKHLRRRFQ